MNKYLSRFFAAILSLTMVMTTVIANPQTANAGLFSSSKKSVAVFRLLNNDSQRPESGKKASSSSYDTLGLGYITPGNAYGDVTSQIISYPNLSNITLNDYQTIEWYSISKDLLTWKVDGQIVNKPEGTKIDAQFRILNDGVGLTADGSFADNENYSVAGTGKIKLTDSYGSDAYKYIVSAPDCSSFKDDNDKIYWFNIGEDDNTWVVEGVIIKVPNPVVDSIPSADAPAQLQVPITADSLSKLNLKIGDKVTTKGYHFANDNGDAQYEISDKASDFSISLNNGLYANLIIDNDTINVKAAGAYGDGKTDDSILLNKILNSGIKNVYFPAGDYRCVYRLEINNVNGLNISGEGKDSIIMTDSEYKGADTPNENFFTLWECSNIAFSDITVKACEQWTVSYSRQLGIYYSDNISFDRCNFLVPSTVKAVGPNTDREYTNLAFYTGWKNVSVDNCYFEQLGGVERGCNIILTDIWNAGCENASITNNTFYHNAHDEMFSIFGGKQDSSYMKNITVTDNKFYAQYSSDVTPRTMCFTFAYTDSKNVSDVTFANNSIDALTPSSLMTFGIIDNCNVYNNTINITNNSDYNNGIVFSGTKDVTVYNNNITINGTKTNGMAIIASGDMTFNENKVKINTSMRYLFTECYIYNNDITISGAAQAIAQAPHFMEGNKVTMNGCVDNFISYQQVNLKYESIVNNNEFIYLYDDNNDAVSFLTGNAVYVNIGTSLNNNMVSFTNNTIKAPNVNTWRKYILAYSVTDTAAQKFDISGNISDEYKDVIYLCQGTEAEIVK